MLDDFKLEQNIAYKIFFNSIKKNKISHAYLIETNGYYRAFEFALALTKALVCPYNYTNSNNCTECAQCRAIDDNNFIELKIIKPDGEWIKKEQLDELQLLFSKKALIGNKKIYIIDQIEKLNVTSANSILKFLEEPEEGIIAILLCENINKILSTIVSRCQIISLKNVHSKLLDTNLNSKVACKIFNSEEEIQKFIKNEEAINIINNVIHFVNYYEDNKIDTLLYIDSLWNCFFNERKELFMAFEIMLLYYIDIMKYKMGDEIEIFNDYKTNIQNICLKNNIVNITKKINIIVDLKDKIKYNINVNLLMDKLLISFKGCELCE